MPSGHKSLETALRRHPRPAEPCSHLHPFSPGRLRGWDWGGKVRGGRLGLPTSLEGISLPPPETRISCCFRAHSDSRRLTYEVIRLDAGSSQDQRKAPGQCHPWGC